MPDFGQFNDLFPTSYEERKRAIAEGKEFYGDAPRMIETECGTARLDYDRGYICTSCFAVVGSSGACKF